MDEELDIRNKVIPKTFFLMFLGLLGTAIFAWYTYASGLLVDILVNGFFNVLLIIELVVVLLFSLLFKRCSATFVGILFFIYSMLNGITLSTIFYCFELNSIIYLFLGSAALFGILAFVGYTTNKDIGNFRSIFFWGLIIGIVVSLINLILKNSMVDIILDWFILLLFCGITVYDMNKIKNFQGDEGINQEKIYVYGAMQLYLDFINIFIRMLSLFGKRRN